MLPALAFLLGSLSIYFTIAADRESRLQEHAALIVEIEKYISENPQRAAGCGLSYTLRAMKHHEAADTNLISGLKTLLIDTAIPLFIISLIWQIHLNRKYAASS